MVKEGLIALQIIIICAIAFSWGIQLNNDDKISKFASRFLMGFFAVLDLALTSTILYYY